uniref:Pentafunctional AROM polypeptide n=1 Tax=Albugo laibachii Nc14 TaxID=890382 RepID=F0WXH3_9STRA|nr:unnamed protein product [Albugo laibachii Nc14]|eukprot:CCA26166.1 unnamed protein product [Albugo laibachii Nc14]
MAAIDRVVCEGSGEATRYEIVLGKDLLDSGWLARDILASNRSISTYLVLTDTNLLSLYGYPLQSMLQQEIMASSESAEHTRQVYIHAIAPGEASKSRERKEYIEDHVLFPNRFHRDSCIIALGGGVVGDLSGYIAATYMRGIPFIQVPTSLLACVDSSIGGKTGIDVSPFGKNLLGSFYMPQRVYVDLSMLKTLPRREFINGMAEVIKAGAIYDSELYELLESRSDEILGKDRHTPLVTPNLKLLQRIVRMAVQVKTHVVTLDTKERGLRAILNFGHSIGHGYEALLQPEYLHGECVAIGMLREAEIARGVGKCSSATVGRLRCCLQEYGLPIKAPESVPVDQVLAKMEIDKKNGKGLKRIVLLESIGKVVSTPAYTTAVSDDQIRLVLEKQVVVKNGTQANGNIRVPGSKSVSNRVLLMAALGNGTCRISGLLHSEDTQVMMAALTKIGAKFSWEEKDTVVVVEGTGGKFKALDDGEEIYLSNAGTAARFLTTTMTLVQAPKNENELGRIILTGNHRMQERPIGPLVESLRQNGCRIQCTGVHEGCPPLAIQYTGFKGGDIRLAAKVSSQYVSSILINAPYAENSVVLELEEEEITSLPYIHMTIELMRAFGIHVEREGKNRFRIPKGAYQNPSMFQVEVDASSASYPLALGAITGGQVVVEALGSSSVQGDAAFHSVLRAMGCETSQTPTSTTVRGPPSGVRLKAIEYLDMETMTDAFMTAAVLAAVAQGTTKIVGIANQRVKECNRIEVMITELSKIGVECGELEDGMWVKGANGDIGQLRKAEIACHNDHRIAMSFAVLGAYVPDISITDKKCTEKTYPEFWDHLQGHLGLRVQAVPTKVTTTVDTDSQVCETLVPTVFLVGMRGSGKSTLGKYASSKLEMEILDTDKELEKEFGKSIPAFVAEHGGSWDVFRQHEKQLMLRLLSDPPANTAVACGGGVVEDPQVLSALSKYPYVVHIRHDDMDSLIAYLDRQAAQNARPALGSQHAKVWEDRQPLYTAASSFEFVVTRSNRTEGGSLDISNLDFCMESFIRFLGVALPNTPYSFDSSSVCVKNSFFLSTTFTNVTDSIDDFPDIIEGVDAVELRVDLLKSTEPAFVSSQVALLRNITSLPIIFTVRSEAQGGQFPDDQEEEMFDLLHLAVRLACEFVDMEVCWSHSYRTEFIRYRKRSAIIGSFHALQMDAPMNEEDIVAIFKSAYHSGDVQVVKVVVKAFGVNDALLVHQIAQNCLNEWDQCLPVIALCTTEQGRLSRVLNSILTPVTHAKLPKAAAPGQLSVKEILDLRSALGMFPARRFYLFGSPVSKSPSPAIHNAGFQAHNLPFQYQLCETLDLEEITRKIRDTTSFGGASVTIPHKIDIMHLLDEISPAARAIGAVNTILREDRVTGAHLKGDNTDWIGILRPIARRLHAQTRPKLASELRALVIGAGGTSMAAAYAMCQLGVGSLYIYNRTFEKARLIAERFGAIPLAELTEVSIPFADIIIGTIPAASGFVLPSYLMQSDHGMIVLDAAYNPPRTPMLEALLSTKSPRQHAVIYGYEMLCEQAYAQYQSWHKLTQIAVKRQERNVARNQESEVYCLMRQQCEAQLFGQQLR